MYALRKMQVGRGVLYMYTAILPSIINILNNWGSIL